MRNIVIAAAFLALAAPAGAGEDSAGDVWTRILPGEAAAEGRTLTPAEALAEARALCRCVPAICRLALRSDLVPDMASESPLFRLLAAALGGRGIDAPTVRAAIAVESMMMAPAPVVPCLEAGP